MKRLITAVILTATSITAQAAASMYTQYSGAKSKLDYCLDAESCQIALDEYIQVRETYRDYFNQACPGKWCPVEEVEFSENGEVVHKFTVSDAEKRITKLKQEKQIAKLPGVKIGMTADQVLYKSSWSKPKSINRTTTSRGSREQWVYGSGNYLYFDNGILTGIQN